MSRHQQVSFGAVVTIGTRPAETSYSATNLQLSLAPTYVVSSMSLVSCTSGPLGLSRFVSGVATLQVSAGSVGGPSNSRARLATSAAWSWGTAEMFSSSKTC